MDRWSRSCRSNLQFRMFQSHLTLLPPRWSHCFHLDPMFRLSLFLPLSESHRLNRMFQMTRQSRSFCLPPEMEPLRMSLRFRMSRCCRLSRSLPAWGSRRWFQPFRWSLKFLIGQLPPPLLSNLKFRTNPQ
jgi:hypothetical protein